MDDDDNADEMPTKPTADSDGTSSDGLGLVEAKRKVLETAEGIIDDPIEGIIKINSTPDGDWSVVLEVLEREAVPDTQDMIGRYEFTVDSSGSIAGYSLVERYKRGDSKNELS
jgi:hypothetical protein